MGSLLSIYAFIIVLFISTVLRAVAVTLHGKRDFADVIKSRIEMVRLFPDYLGESLKYNHKCPYKREVEGDLTIKGGIVTT